MWPLTLLGLVPALLKGAVEILTPLFKGFAEFLVWLVQTMWEGFTDIIDNPKTLVTVGILIFAPLAYEKWEHKQEVKAIHADYRAKWQPKRNADASQKNSKPVKAEDYSKYPNLDMSKLFKW